MEFAEAVEMVRRLEEKALEYEPPESAGIAKRRIEFSPQEYSNISYAEALGIYARVEKVIASEAMLQKEIYGIAPKAEPEVPTVVPVVVAPRGEEAPRPPAREPVEEAAPPEPQKEAVGPEVEEKKGGVPPAGLEFEESGQAWKGLEFEEAPKRKLEIEVKAPEEAQKPPEEKPAARKGVPPEVSLRIPPVLSTSPLESAIREVEKLEKQFSSEVRAGGKVNREDAKKRMLELTRELFKEKSIDRREEIKKEIVALKAILSEGEGKARPRADIFTVVKNDQEYEVSSAKKSLREAYENAIAPLLKYYDEEAALGRAKEAAPALEERAAKLREQVANLIAAYEGFLVGKHSAELEELAKRGKGVKEIESRMAELASSYSAEFANLRGSIWGEIDAAVEKRKGGVEGGEESDEELLAYLQREEPLDYQMYARGEITRAQALSEARRKLAARKEK